MNLASHCAITIGTILGTLLAEPPAVADAFVGKTFVVINENGLIVITEPGLAPISTDAPSGHFRAVAHGKGLFIAVGSRGLIAFSPDASHWTQIPSPTISSLYDVTFGNSLFVAVGNEGAILRSNDGLSWTPATNVTETRLRGIAYGNRQFVAIGHEGLLITSINGVDWKSQDSGTSVRLETIAYGNSQFVAAGWNGVILRGADKHWRLSQMPAFPRFTRVTFQATEFQLHAETGAAFSSSTGANWRPLELAFE